MTDLFSGSELIDLITEVRAGQRLGFEDGVRLFNSNDLLAIGYMADIIRRRKNGNKVYFVSNRHINHNFGVDKDSPAAFSLSLDEIAAKAAEMKNQRISEIHIAGGLNPELPLQYYLDMMRRVKKALPGVHIQAFTVVEIDYFAQTSGLSVEEVLRQLIEAGLGSLSGGGAEVFAPRARKKICENKVSGDRWLEIMDIAHGLGMRTNATMLYGHIETIEERVDHLLRLRELQDKTGGFVTFVPMAFHPKNTEDQLSSGRTTGFDDIKVLSVARILLDNFDHVKAFWTCIGPKLAQVSLGFGVDDLGGTVVEEKITHATSAETSQAMTRQELVKMIKAAGYEPVERDTLYNTVNEF